MRLGISLTFRAMTVLEKEEDGTTLSMIRATPSSEAIFFGMLFSCRHVSYQYTPHTGSAHHQGPRRKALLVLVTLEVEAS